MTDSSIASDSADNSSAEELGFVETDDDIPVKADDSGSGGQKMVPLPALNEAREKSRKLAEKLDEMQLRLEISEQQRAQQNQPTRQEKPELTDDEIYADVPKALRRMKAEAKEEYENKLRDHKYAQSDRFARQMHDDYDETIAHYMTLAKKQPHIAQMVEADPAPSLAAYQIAKADLAQSKLMDPKQFNATVAEEVAKQVAAALKQHGRGAAKEVPPSFSSGGSGSRGEAPDDPDDFARVFKKKW